MPDNSNLSCSFCGKSRDNVDKLIAGPQVYICNECVELSYQIVVEDLKSNATSTEYTDLPKPSEIKQFLDEYIISHDETKQMLSVSAYNHYKRIFNPSDVELEKSNVLIIGPTGTGKTLFAKTLAKKLDVPFAIADATTLTEAGYVGEDVESVLERLLVTADFDVEKAQRGIIYIDEIDKKARKGESNTSTKDVSGEGVQQALLRLIEGTTTKVKVNNGKKLSEDYIEFDTSQVLFIVGGAFVGIEKIVERRIKKNSSIGFGAKVTGEEERKELIKDLMPEDVVEFGIIPELMGRLPILGILDVLEESDLVQVMTTAKNNVIDQSKALLKMDDINLEFGDEYIKDAAGLATKKKLGARAIKSIVENSLISIMYRAPDLRDAGVTDVLFDKYPLQNSKPMLTYDDGKQKIDTGYRLYRGSYK